MKRAIRFYVLVFVISSIYFLLYSIVPQAWMTLYLFIAMWIPGWIGIVFLKREKKPLKEWLIWSIKPNRYFWIGLLAPVGLMGLIVLGGWLVTPSEFDFPQSYRDLFDQASIPIALHWPLFIVQIVLNGILFGGTLNALFALGEELGWRGFLTSATQTIPIWKSGLAIGFFWGLWHAPLVLQGYNFPDSPVLGVFLMAVACAPLGLLMSILVKRGQSVVVAALFHGVFNAVAGVTFLLFVDPLDWLHGPFGLVAILVYSLVAFIAWVWEERSKRRSMTA